MNCEVRGRQNISTSQLLYSHCQAHALKKKSPGEEQSILLLVKIQRRPYKVSSNQNLMAMR